MLNNIFDLNSVNLYIWRFLVQIEYCILQFYAGYFSLYCTKAFKETILNTWEMTQHKATEYTIDFNNVTWKEAPSKD